MTEKQFFVICLWVETAGSGAQAFQFLWELGTAWKIFIISHQMLTARLWCDEESNLKTLHQNVSEDGRIAGNVLREQSTLLVLYWLNCSVNKFLYFWLLSEMSAEDRSVQVEQKIVTGKSEEGGGKRCSMMLSTKPLAKEPAWCGTTLNKTNCSKLPEIASDMTWVSATNAVSYYNFELVQFTWTQNSD